MAQAVRGKEEVSGLPGDAFPLAFIDLVACAVLAAGLDRSSVGWSSAASAGTDAPARVAARNAELAHRLEFDGYDPLAMGHPATVLVPALLAVWEATGRGSGQELTRAFAVGKAAAYQLAAMVGPAMVEMGLHPTAELGPVAAGVACRTLLHGQAGISVRQALTEFGRFPRSSRSDFGTPNKARHVGEATGQAVAFALGQGPDGRPDPIAFYRQLGMSDEALSMQLHEGYRAGPGTIFKHLPVCGYLLPTLTIASALRSEVRARGGLASLTLTVPEAVARDAGRPVPATLDEARFSLRFLAWLVLDNDNPSGCLLSEHAFDDALRQFERMDADGCPLVRYRPDNTVDIIVGTVEGATLSTSGDPRQALRSLNRFGVERKLRLAVSAHGRPTSAAEDIIAMVSEFGSVTVPEYSRVVRTALREAGSP